MDKQQAANLLQEQLDQISALRDLSPDHPDFQLWRENALTLMQQYFSDQQRWLDAFSEWPYLPHVIKHEDELEFTEYDKQCYLGGLQGGEVAIKAALNKLKLFGITPQSQPHTGKQSSFTVQVINNLTNQQTVSVNVSFEQIIQTIENTPDKAEEEKSQAKEKIKELEEELKHEHPTWDKIKPILVWLLGFGEKVFIQVLPYILAKYGGKQA